MCILVKQLFFSHGMPAARVRAQRPRRAGFVLWECRRGASASASARGGVGGLRALCPLQRALLATSICVALMAINGREMAMALAKKKTGKQRAQAPGSPPMQ